MNSEYDLGLTIMIILLIIGVAFILLFLAGYIEFKENNDPHITNSTITRFNTWSNHTTNCNTEKYGDIIHWKVIALIYAKDYLLKHGGEVYLDSL